MRTALVGVLKDLLAWGRELVARTNDTFAADVPSPTERIVALLGQRTLFGLRACRALATEGLDDQVAILCRSIGENAIDIEYLLVDTLRNGRRLSPELKASLFTGSLLIEAERAGKLSPEDAQQLQEVRAERQEAGVTRHIFWHGARQGDLIAELVERHRQTPAAVAAIRSMNRSLRRLAFYAHPNPNLNAYLEQDSETATVRLRDRFRLDAALATGLTVAAHIFFRWGLCILGEAAGEELADRRDALHRRLHDLAPQG